MLWTEWASNLKTPQEGFRKLLESSHQDSQLSWALPHSLQKTKFRDQNRAMCIQEEQRAKCSTMTSVITIRLAMNKLIRAVFWIYNYSLLRKKSDRKNWKLQRKIDLIKDLEEPPVINPHASEKAIWKIFSNIKARSNFLCSQMRKWWRARLESLCLQRAATRLPTNDLKNRRKSWKMYWITRCWSQVEQSNLSSSEKLALKTLISTEPISTLCCKSLCWANRGNSQLRSSMWISSTSTQSNQSSRLRST